MRIATFNLENLDMPLGVRAAILRPALQRLAADVLCLQEVNGQRAQGGGRHLRALDALLEGTDYAGYCRVATHPPGRDAVADVHNLVTLSRLPILAHRQILHDIVPPAAADLVTSTPRGRSEIRFERPALVTELDAGGVRLTVVNLHLRAPLASAIPGAKTAPFVWKEVGGWAEGYYLSGLKRTGQALEVRLMLDRIFGEDPEARVLVTGDFNAEDHETPLRILIGAPEDTGNQALADRSLVLLDRGLDPARRFSVIHNGRPQMVDHMLASHALYGAFRGIAVHNEPLGDEVVGWTRGIEAAGSYHAPVVAEFDLPAPAPPTIP